jgi:Tol biopolymer transport system component
MRHRAALLRLAVIVAAALAALAAASRGACSVRSPSWASAGFIVYKCGDALCVIRPDGSGRRELLSRPGRPVPQWDAAFASDADAVAFRGYFAFGDGDYALYTARAGGCGVRRLTRSIAGNPSWSPNGRWIAFDTSGEGVIWKLHPDGTALTRLVGAGGADYDEAPAWSPNGREIAFLHYRHGRGELWLVDADGRNPRLLHRDRLGSVGPPAWSHDGTKIAFAVQTTRGKSVISLVDPAGSNLRRLTSRTGGAWNPSWLPRDEGIAYLERTGNTGSVFVVRSDGSDTTRLTLPQTAQFAWVARPLPRRC